MQVENWGLVEYDKALQKQLECVQKVRENPANEVIVVCHHPPVVTLGRGTREGDLTDWNGSVVQVSRGGRATYHGPNQVVIYPIVDLNARVRDLHKFMKLLENAMVSVLSEYGIEAEGRQGDATGVWIGERKIASIGIAATHWITYHGLAFNLLFDANAFRGINPCGFTAQTMISLEEAAGRRISRDEFESKLVKTLLQMLEEF